MHFVFHNVGILLKYSQTVIGLGKMALGRSTAQDYYYIKKNHTGKNK